MDDGRNSNFRSINPHKWIFYVLSIKRCGNGLPSLSVLHAVSLPSRLSLDIFASTAAPLRILPLLIFLLLSSSANRTGSLYRPSFVFLISAPLFPLNSSTVGTSLGSSSCTRLIAADCLIARPSRRIRDASRRRRDLRTRYNG